MRRIATTLTVAALVSLAAAGCGSDKKTTASAGGDTATTQGSASGGRYGDGGTATTVAGSAGSSTGSTGSTADTVTIQSFKFSAITVKAGSTVKVANKDGFEHTLTADKGQAGFDANVDLGGSESGQFTAPAAPGTYKFHCEIHGASSMSGTLTVTA